MTKLRTIHQIEISSRCNLRCKYCPSPHLKRPKMDMEPIVFTKALNIVRHFAKQGTQHIELNLAGIGESTMHPLFLQYVKMAREALGPTYRILLATNGILFNENMALHLAKLNVRVYISAHRPEKAGPAIEIAKHYGILDGVSVDPTIASVDWAGQVDWHVSAAQGRKCDWIRGGWGMVMADGRITTCCFDASGIGVIGDVDSNIDELYVSPYELCKSCHLEV